MRVLSQQLQSQGPGSEPVRCGTCPSTLLALPPSQRGLHCPGPGVGADCPLAAQEGGPRTLHRCLPQRSGDTRGLLVVSEWGGPRRGLSSPGVRGSEGKADGPARADTRVGNPRSHVRGRRPAVPGFHAASGQQRASVCLRTKGRSRFLPGTRLWCVQGHRLIPLSDGAWGGEWRTFPGGDPDSGPPEGGAL